MPVINAQADEAPFGLPEERLGGVRSCVLLFWSIRFGGPSRLCGPFAVESVGTGGRNCKRILA